MIKFTINNKIKLYSLIIGIIISLFAGIVLVGYFIFSNNTIELPHANKQNSAQFMVQYDLAVQKLIEQDKIYEAIAVLLRTSTQVNAEYASYYLLKVAQLYIQIGEDKLAQWTYNTILSNYDEISFNDYYSYDIALENVMNNTAYNYHQLAYYNLYTHINGIDESYPVRLFEQASIYEQLGEYTTQYQLYEDILAYYNKNYNYDSVSLQRRFQEKIVPDLYFKVKERLDFHYSQKDWLEEDIDVLVQSIKNAIYQKNVSKVLRRRADVGFFAMSYLQNQYDYNSRVPAYEGVLRTFLYNVNIIINPEFEKISSANEKYLRTSGWSFRVPIWYFYFKRVRYPADPDINRSWEWSGIYFGEHL